MPLYMFSPSLLLFLSQVYMSFAACPRPVLQLAHDSLFQAGKPSTSSLKLSSNVKISENNLPIVSLQQSFLANVTGYTKPLHITVLDEEKCTVAAFSVPKSAEGGNILSTRMTITPNGEITELELVHPPPWFTLPSFLPEQTNATWTRPYPAPRDQMLKVLNSYPDGIALGDGTNVPTASTCTRYENGFGIPLACNAAFWLFQTTVSQRRWYVDTATGIALGNFVFDQSRTPGMIPQLWLQEYFKIADGKIFEIYAAMELMWPSYRDVWGPEGVLGKGS
jgi:hypothetical protein